MNLKQFAVLLPLVTFFGFGAWLSIIDLKTHRLPNQIIAGLTLSLSLELLVIGVAESDWKLLSNALAIALGYLAIFVLIYLLSRGQLGLGDVKFSVSCGLVVGWYATSHWLWAIWLTFLLAGVVAVGGILLRLIHLKSAIAFGPYMYLATCLVSGYGIVN